MKTLAFFATILVANVSMARQPNMYNCHEIDNPKYLVNYFSSSHTGRPHMNIQSETGSVVPGPGGRTLDLSQVITPLGRLVSAVLTPKFIADAPSLVYSLVLPEIDLGGLTRVEFKTVLLIGLNGGFMPLPATLQQVTAVKHLSCVANRVFF